MISLLWVLTLYQGRKGPNSGVKKADWPNVSDKNGAHDGYLPAPYNSRWATDFSKGIISFFSSLFGPRHDAESVLKRMATGQNFVFQ